MTRQPLEESMQNYIPTVIFRDTVECDGCGDLARLVTDGHVGSALTLDLGNVGTLLRNNQLIEAQCLAERHNVPCHGYFTWDLSEDGTWVAGTNLADEFLRLAQPMEVAS